MLTAALRFTLVSSVGVELISFCLISVQVTTRDESSRSFGIVTLSTKNVLLRFEVRSIPFFMLLSCVLWNRFRVVYNFLCFGKFLRVGCKEKFEIFLKEFLRILEFSWNLKEF